MKKLLWVTALCAALAVLFVGCGNVDDDEGNGKNQKINITFTAGFAGGQAPGQSTGQFSDGTTSKVVQINEGSTVTPPGTPGSPGYKFAKWTTQQSGGGTEWTPTLTHSKATTYYAIYEEEDLENDFTSAGTWNFDPDVDYENIDADRVRKTVFNNDIINALKANPKGIVDLSFTATGGNGSDRNGWGIGKLGIYEGDAVSLTSPNPSSKDAYSIRVEAKWLVDIIASFDTGDELGMYTPVNNGDKLLKMELFAPKDPNRVPLPRTLPPAVPASVPKNYYEFVQEIATTGGSFLDSDPMVGKGKIAGVDYEAILNPVNEKGVLRLYLYSDADRGGWNDLGRVGFGSDLNNNTSLTYGGVNGGTRIDDSNWIFELSVSALVAKKGSFAGNEITVNPYNQTAITKCELWIPQAGIEIPDFELQLETGEGKYTGMIIEDSVFEGRRLLKNDVYEITFSLKSDASISALTFCVVDNAATTGWAWIKLIEEMQITDISAGERKDVTLEFTINDWASESSKEAGRLVFDSPVAANLEFYDFVVNLKTEGEPLPDPPYEPSLTAPGFIYLGDFTDGEKTWNADGYQGATSNFAPADLLAAKYLIVEVAKPASQNGFGGLQFAYQGEPNPSGWNQANISGNWNQPGCLDYNPPHNFYIVIDLATITGWNAFITGAEGQAKIILNSGWNVQFAVVAGFLTSVNLTPAEDSITNGWVALDVPEGKAPAASLTAPGFIYLGDFTDGEKTWNADGYQGATSNFAPADLLAAKYLIVEVAKPANQNGFGGLQFAYQGEPNPNGWNQTNISGDWNQPSCLDYNPPHNFYIVIDLATITGWNAFITGAEGQAKIILNYGWNVQFAVVTGFLTSVNLTPAADSITNGWVALDVPEGK